MKTLSNSERGNKYSKVFDLLSVCLFVVSLLFFSSGCSNKRLAEKRQQFKQMSDNELLNYYREINDRLDDIDRNVEMERNRAVSSESINDSCDAPAMLQHLHIGDTWHGLQQEKRLILKEMQVRNITP